ncbi:DUF2141 domain-containing protein [Hyphomicrobiales bacterium]|nr:DUF2141 domain-containing protein [Hyphomicrobiales bacterium]|tara:strand:+ start:209 stop:670 length:462 start_codon:yes stop_codon:yes gene_type:complete
MYIKKNYKLIFKLSIILLIFNQNLYAETLIVNIESNYDKGLALIGIYDKEEHFGKAKVNKKLNSEKVLTGAVTKITNNKAQIKFDIPFGSYALSGFQDFDNNGVMSGNFLGIPKEPFGFSNDARGKFGPPKWNDAVFIFNTSNQEVTLKLKKL